MVKSAGFCILASVSLHHALYDLMHLCKPISKGDSVVESY